MKLVVKKIKRWGSQFPLFFILVFGGFIVLIILGQIWQYEFRTHSRYTIGTTTGTYWTLRSGEKVEYVYFVNNKKNVMSDNYKDSTKALGGRYFVKYDTKKPFISSLLQDKPVPDSIKTAPPDGWKDIPVTYDSQQ